MKGPGRPPVYPKVAAEIERRIVEGEILDKLPTYRELVKEFQVSSRTVDRAVEMLKGRGVIYSRPSRGLFVLRNKKDGS